MGIMSALYSKGAAFFHLADVMFKDGWTHICQERWQGHASCFENRKRESLLQFYVHVSVLSACKQVSHLSQGPKGESKSDVRSVVE